MKIKGTAKFFLCTAAAIAMLFAITQPCCAAQQDIYNVAVLPSWNNHPHSREFDFAFQQYGYSWTNLQESAQQMDWLDANLDKFDMLFAPCLFGYTPDNSAPPFDMTKYAGHIRQWIMQGGSLFIIDANYPKTLAWLKSIDKSLEVSSEKCDYLGPAVAEEPLDSILFLPKQAEYTFSWNHMTVPDQEKTGWKIISRCGHGDPTLMIKRLGKGIILITVGRNYIPEFIENLRVNQNLQSFSLEILSCNLPDVIPGTNAFSVVCKNTSEKKLHGKLILSVTSLDEDGNPSGTPEIFSSESEIAPGTAGEFKLECRISMRGHVRAEMKLVSGNAEGICFDRVLKLPPLFSITGTAHRGLVSEARRFPYVRIGAQVYPDKTDQTELSLRISVTNSRNSCVGSVQAPAQIGSFMVPVEVPKKLPAGKYSVFGELLDKNGAVISSSTSQFEVVPVTPGQTLFDEDSVMLREGRPFFPVGIYHINAGSGPYTSELGRIADIGFNMVQTFSWAGTWHINEIQKHGLATLWEQLPHRTPEACAIQGEVLSTHPSTLMYYTMDEPPQSLFDFVKQLDDAWHQADPFHPTYVVSYQPHQFHRNVWLSDVLAPDPYPYSTKKGEESPITNVSKWMDLAGEVSGWSRPYICVPQSFGKEPPLIWRNMAFQAIVHGAKGLIWYPWNDGGKSGMRWDPELLREAEILIPQINALSPAILNHDPQPRKFTDENYDIHAMVCRNPETGTYYAIFVNTAATAVSADIEIPEIPGSLDFVEGIFGTPKASVSNSVLSLSLPKFATGIYFWGGPAPVLEKNAKEFALGKLPPRASGRTIKVVSSQGTAAVPAGAYTNLQDAIDIARHGDVISVGPGVYSPIVSENKLIDIVAEIPGTNTVIDAFSNDRCATLSVKTYGDMTAQTNTLLRGFVLRSGNASKSRHRSTMGGCVIGGTLEDCSIERGIAQYGGGAAYCNISSSKIFSNRASLNGGGAYLCRVSDSEIYGNSATFDGGAFELCSAYFCEIFNNNASRDGGAMHFSAAESCKIRGNSARRNGGGGAHSNIRNSIVTANNASRNGGGAFAGTIEFSTLFSNTAAGKGGGFSALDSSHGWGANVGVTDSIIWSNTSRSDTNETASIYNISSVTRSCVQSTPGSAAIRGAITNNPSFMNPSISDFRLRPDSPCIDMNTIKSGTPVQYDPDGKKRPGGGGYDAGAYEAVPANFYIGDWEFDGSAFNAIRNKPSKFTAAEKQIPLPKLKDGALVFDGSSAVKSARSLSSFGTNLKWWSKLRFSITFSDAKSGTLLYVPQGADGGLWAEIDNSGRLRVTYILGNAKDNNKTVLVSGQNVAGGKNITAVIELYKFGDDKTVLSATVNGKPAEQISAPEIKTAFSLPSGNFFLGCKDARQRNFFRGVVNSLKIELDAE